MKMAKPTEDYVYGILIASQTRSSVIHTLTHLETKDLYACLLFLNFISAFNTIIAQTGAKTSNAWPELLTLLLGPGLLNQQGTACQN